MTLPRLRIRTLMIAVDFVALTLAAETGRRRTARLRMEYRAKAAMWRRKTSVALPQAAARYYAAKRAWDPDPEIVRQYETHARRAKHARLMERKYRLAARRSWLPVAPDPPAPK